VVPSGFPLPVKSRFSGGLTINGYPIRRPYVLLTNRHYPQKRFDLAIRAIQEVRKRLPKVQLVIPGPSTSHTAALKALAAELKLTDSVLFLGPITEEELQKLYEGVPVVAWNQAGPTVTMGPGTGHLAEPLEVADYAGGIASLLDDPNANQATGERAFDWARRFDWERHLDTLERSILDVARSHEQVAAEAASA
jgi:glycosyltransferase involved in cell wall biosynthesis